MFDNILFTKKYFEQNSREIDNHLPQEISRVTIFMLDRGASQSAKPKSSLYWRYLLVQEVLEIRCTISIETRSCFDMAVFESCNYIKEELQIEPMGEKTVGVVLARGNYAGKFA